MAEYAKKETLIKKLIEVADDFEQRGGIMNTAFAVSTKEIVELLNDKNCSIFEEAKPIVHAHWVTDFDFDPEEEQELYFYFCSNCKNELFGDKEDFKYCPYCGALMNEPISQTHENGVKIPVISMEDVPNLAKEMENNV